MKPRVSLPAEVLERDGGCRDRSQQGERCIRPLGHPARHVARHATAEGSYVAWRDGEPEELLP